jgi:hypothetical protein
LVLSRITDESYMNASAKFSVVRQPLRYRIESISDLPYGDTSAFCASTYRFGWKIPPVMVTL